MGIKYGGSAKGRAEGGQCQDGDHGDDKNGQQDEDGGSDFGMGFLRGGVHGGGLLQKFFPYFITFAGDFQFGDVNIL